jgi:hypothetical protein
MQTDVAEVTVEALQTFTAVWNRHGGAGGIRAAPDHGLARRHLPVS